MILTCGECGTRFSVDPAKIGPAGRIVRCGTCGHEWRQAKISEDASTSGSAPAAWRSIQPIELAAEPKPERADPDLPRPRREERRGGRLGWLLLLLFVAVVAVGAVRERDRIVEAWPAAARLYIALGLANGASDGLEFRNVTSKREADGDATVLIVAGQIANVSRETKDVPPLRGVLHDSSEHEVRQWSFPVKDAHLPPGAVTGFETRVRNPPAYTGLTIEFVDGS